MKTKLLAGIGKNIFLRTCAISFSFFLASSASIAQCIVSNLEITTGLYNGGTIPVGSSDPNWFTSNKTGNFTGSLPPVGSNVLVVNRPSSWPTDGIWICDNQAHAYPGITTTVPSFLTFQRRFRLCSDDDVTFTLGMRSDGIITDILVDGVSTGLVQPTPNWSGGPIWSPTPFTQTLTGGSHTLEIVVADSPATFSADPIGFFMVGNIASVNSSIINDQNPDCAEYACPRCNDQCYWTVDGNNIYSSRNIFGTLTDDNIRIVTNGSSVSDRGVIMGGDGLTGGYLGWNNTNPTARVHVDCRNGNNPSNIFGLPSDIRFENLERGSGNILVIDKEGYVYDSGKWLDGVPGKDGGDAPGELSTKQELRELKAQLADMRRALAASGVPVKEVTTGSKLYQNVPNPFDRETVIKYNVDRMQSAAAIIIYDLTGKELKKYAINQTGEGIVNISADTLQPGMYLYSLVIDGQETDTKRMILSK